VETDETIRSSPEDYISPIHCNYQEMSCRIVQTHRETASAGTGMKIRKKTELM
jgi:hypothetical protein